MLECVVNVSEGRDGALIDRLASSAGPLVLDVHRDADHHRSVFTLAGEGVEDGVRALTAAAVDLLDIRAHAGAHPRIGVVDVVPFVSLTGRSSTGPGGPGGGSGPGDGGGPGGAGRTGGPAGRLWLADGSLDAAVAARDRFAEWAGRTLALPCFLYGPGRTLPEVRRGAWATLVPDAGQSRPHPTAGATAVGARPSLVAYNLWLGAGADLPLARAVAADIRSPHIRALGLQVGTSVQVSCNLISPWQVGPGAAFDLVSISLGRHGGRSGIERAELVGLIPQAALDAEPARRWAELDLDPSKTIEARLERAGLDGGRFT
jgi:glutamate formiminotransferase / 5-formyltetrahydrofolate cyclo-ligase